MKVCDKCRKQISSGQQCLGSELCTDCANRVKEWIKKPLDKSLFGFLK